MTTPKRPPKKTAATTTTTATSGERVALVGGLVAELTPPKLRRATVVVADGRIESIDEAPPAGVTAIDCTGLLVTAGFVDGHARLATGAAQLGQRAPRQTPSTHSERLQRLVWPLARALDADTLGALTEAAALAALHSGTTAVFDLVDAPGCVDGALDVVAAAIDKVGLRGAIAISVAERQAGEAKAALREAERFFAREPLRAVKATIGAEGAYLLDETIADGLADLALRHQTALHTLLGADSVDARHQGWTATAWLTRRGLIGAGAVCAHGIHVDEDDAARLRESGAFIVHCPRAEQLSVLDFSRPGRFGDYVVLGSGGLDVDVRADAVAAALWSAGRRHTVDVAGAVAASYALQAWHFGLPFGLQPGAAADLIAVDYRPTTPLDAGNLAAHVVAGLPRARTVHAVVDGRVVLENGASPRVDEAAVRARAQKAVAALWSHLAF